MLSTKFLLFSFMVLLSPSELHAENEENEGNKYSPLTGLYKKFAGGVQKIAKDLIDQSNKKDKPVEATDAPVDGAQEEKPKEESKVEPKDDSVSHDEWADGNLSDGYRDQPSWDDQLRDGVYRDRPDRDGGFRDWDDQLRDGIDRDIGFRDQFQKSKKIKHDCVRDGIAWDNQLRDGFLIYRDHPDRDRSFRDQPSWDDQIRDGVYRDRANRDGGYGFRDGLRDAWDSPLRDGAYRDAIAHRAGFRDQFYWDYPLRDRVLKDQLRDDGYHRRHRLHF